MKGFFGMWAGVSLLVLAISIPAAARAAENLVLNPSFEEGEAGTPAHWHASSWGENSATFAYPIPGVSGSAVRVELHEHTNGDAKWFFSDVSVTPGERYVFSAQYQSDISGRIAVRYNPAESTCAVDDGGCVYDDIGTFSASASWQSVAASFIVPDGITSLTIFLLIEENGWLEIDDVNLTRDLPATITDGVPNYSLEEGSASDPAMPKGWIMGHWGSGTPLFSYVTDDGRDGSRSVKVVMTGYGGEGDAKWLYEPQPVTAGEDYLFTGWYKSDVVPHVVAQYILNDGSERYFGMPRPEPASSSATTWQQYVAEFSVPSGVVRASVFFFIAEDGWLQVDDFHVTPYQYEPFDRPIVTLTFDDGAEQNIVNVLPKLNELGLQSTQCYATKYIFDSDEEHNAVGDDDVLAFYNTGHEICSHTVTHPFLSQLDPEALDHELRESQRVLEEIIGAPVPNFASPYGDYDASVITALNTYYGAHRTVNEGFNSKDNLDLYRLKVQNMKQDTTLAEVQEWVNKAIADKTWLILVYHKVDSSGVEAFDTYLDDFNAQMDWLASRVEAGDVAVLRLDEAIAEVTGAGVPEPEPTCEDEQVLAEGVCVNPPTENDPADATPPRRSGGGGRPQTAFVTPPILPVVAEPLGFAAADSSQFLFTTDLGLGSVGVDVTELQKRLLSEGIYTGPVTGYFGPLTFIAVQAYQARQGIAQTGFVGPQTRSALNAGVEVEESSREALLARIVELEALLTSLTAQLAARLEQQ